MIRLLDFLRLVCKGFSIRKAATMSQSDPTGDMVVLLAVFAFFAWIGLDSLNGWLDQRERHAVMQAEQQSKAKIEQLERVVLGCLQDGVIAIDGIAHECRPVSLKVKI